MNNNLKKKTNIKKIIIIFIISICFIVLFSILGIKVAEVYNKKFTAKRLEKKNSVYEENNILTENMPVGRNNLDKININIMIPVYSEETKRKMKNLYKSDKKIAYLTFDDGPSQAVTPLILDLLKKEDIKATFFLLGKRVKGNPDLVKREYNEGHYIANHGYTHIYDKIYKSANNVLKEYNQTEKEIKKAIGLKEYSSHLFRFPGGYAGGKYAKLKISAGKELNKNDISFIDWNALNSDAAGANTKKKLINNIKNTVKEKNVVVILMHDAPDKILTYETLPDIIKYLRDKGYSFDNFYSIMK